MCTDVWLSKFKSKNPAARRFIKNAIAHPDEHKTLCFINGLLLTKPIGKPLFIPHTPNYFTLTKLPYDYDPDAKCPNWLEFLKRMMENDADRIKLIQQWFKYVLSDNLRQQKFLLCSGEGANGKGVMTEVLVLLIGPKNCSHISLSDFGSRFALYHTLNKKLNTTTESSKQQNPKAVELFKAFTSGDTMTFEKKGGAHLDVKPTAKAMISTNNLPHFNDTTNAIWRRMLLIQFKLDLPETEWDINFVKNVLSKEISGIFNWANQADISKGFVKPEDSRRAMVVYKQDTNPARAFLEENYVADDGGSIETQMLFLLYKRYCGAMNCVSINERSFGKEVWRVFPKIKKGKTPLKNGKRLNTYEGLVEKKFDSKTDNLNKDKKKMIRILIPEDDYYVDDIGKEWHKQEFQS